MFAVFPSLQESIVAFSKYRKNFLSNSAQKNETSLLLLSVTYLVEVLRHLAGAQRVFKGLSRQGWGTQIVCVFLCVFDFGDITQKY